MPETLSAEKWIYATLAADGALAAVVGTRIYADRIPQNVASPYPCVLFGFLSGVDFNAVGSVRVWTNMLYVVRAIDEVETFLGNIKTAAGRIDAVLHRASGSTSEGTVWAAIREQPYRMSEEAEGRVFSHLGGVFRILAI